MRTCFISAPVNLDLSTLKSVLDAKGIRTILPFELEITGANFREQIEKAIRKADLFIAVLTSPADSANVFFELGYGWARHKRVLIVQSGSFSVPQNLSEFPILKVNVTDRRKLSAVLDDFLAQQRRSKSPVEKDGTKTKALSARARQLIQHLKNLEKRATHQELENILTSAFRESGIQALTETPPRDRGYDFALWLDELEHLVGNPILVEVKLRLSKASAISLKNQFLQRGDVEVGKALLVVYLDGPEAQISSVNSGAPLVLFISVGRLLSELEQNSLGKFIRSERNRLVHGI
jgi:nucleoside 2-deoxyribosyltransferase